jgi:hypothetical protein
MRSFRPSSRRSWRSAEFVGDLGDLLNLLGVHQCMFLIPSADRFSSRSVSRSDRISISSSSLVQARSDRRESQKKEQEKEDSAPDPIARLCGRATFSLASLALAKRGPSHRRQGDATSIAKAPARSDRWLACPQTISVLQRHEAHGSVVQERKLSCLLPISATRGREKKLWN